MERLELTVLQRGNDGAYILIYPDDAPSPLSRIAAILPESYLTHTGLRKPTDKVLRMVVELEVQDG